MLNFFFLSPGLSPAVRKLNNANPIVGLSAVCKDATAKRNVARDEVQDEVQMTLVTHILLL